jgi:hypothetical protein
MVVVVFCSVPQIRDWPPLAARASELAHFTRKVVCIATYPRTSVMDRGILAQRRRRWRRSKKLVVGQWAKLRTPYLVRAS